MESVSKSDGRRQKVTTHIEGDSVGRLERIISYLQGEVPKRLIGVRPSAITVSTVMEAAAERGLVVLEAELFGGKDGRATPQAT